ncbi:hypothetical protein Taro_043041 [Colocasia esculenta]|uniref:Uncharacterized protein n=1 Tax=Colocasia esculenta TaxID=4460 RepID=A0A843WIE7_COLES|nr:hypothetical protein [Colocasia esculenta]
MQTQSHTQAALQAQLEAQPSLRTRLVAFDHRTLDEALSTACRQEGEMEQYLEEKKASQKRPASMFQRQDKKKVVYSTQQRSVAVGSSQRPQDQGLSETSAGSPARSASPSSSGSSASYRKTRKASSPSSSMKDYDAILGLDWLEEHYALVDCRRKRIVFHIPGEDEFSYPLPRNLAGKLVISAMKVMRMRSKACSGHLPRQGGSWNIEEGIPDLGLLWRLLKNPEEGFLGSFLGLPKESFTAIFDPSGDFWKASVVGDDTLAEEAVETDSERGD